jgi:hypothetical protein
VDVREEAALPGQLVCAQRERRLVVHLRSTQIRARARVQVAAAGRPRHRRRSPLPLEGPAIPAHLAGEWAGLRGGVDGAHRMWVIRPRGATTHLGGGDDERDALLGGMQLPRSGPLWTPGVPGSALGVRGRSSKKRVSAATPSPPTT